MATDILMPQLGETVAEGTITVWHKRLGDRIAHGDALFEIETDKASMEVPAIVSGILTHINVNAGETATIGAVVGVIDSEPQAHATPAAKPAAAAAASGNGADVSARAAPLDPFQAVRSPERNFGKSTLPTGVKTSPLARRLAATAGIDLTRVKGSGPGGRVVAEDVRRAGQAAAPTASASASSARGATSEQVKALYAGVRLEQLPLGNMRRTIARRLTEAKQSVPHFYLTADIDVEELTRLRAEFNSLDTTAAKISINDLIVRAYALALQRVPEANVVWAEDCILKFSQVDLGIAVAVDGGLYTPIVRNAETKPIAAISAEIRALARAAKDGKLKPADYQGGCATISNLGMFGVRQFAAIVNPPQSTILAVGAAERRPTEGADGSIAFRSMMTATLSCDHRVVDGATGAKLLEQLKAVLQSPLRLLL